ncbi:MAG TPA: ferritin family protein [bacterium]|nr:ferritin family protein [bacterium]HQG44403.1 ferritin family protein [bacterium]HQI48218.1 ferritin family protein [bacterium]HQJ64790.1 ferritin family protein [bacterium]
MTEVEKEKLNSMREILLTAIHREEEAYTFYISARQCARTPTEEEMFNRLAAQEMQHKRALEIQLEEINNQLEMDRALSYDIS